MTWSKRADHILLVGAVAGLGAAAAGLLMRSPVVILMGGGVAFTCLLILFLKMNWRDPWTWLP